MTKRQIRLCKIIRKYKYLDRIMKKAKLSEEDDLQDALLPDYILDYEDLDSPKTIVILPNNALEYIEKKRTR